MVAPPRVDRFTFFTTNLSLSEMNYAPGPRASRRPQSMRFPPSLGRHVRSQASPQTGAAQEQTFQCCHFCAPATVLNSTWGWYSSILGTPFPSSHLCINIDTFGSAWGHIMSTLTHQPFSTCTLTSLLLSQTPVGSNNPTNKGFSFLLGCFHFGITKSGLN